jgi:hypothetical protein
VNVLLDWNEPQLRAWIAEGHSVPWIATQTGNTYDAVRLKLRRMGESTKPAERTHCPRRHHRYAEVGSTVTERGHRVCHACRAMHSSKCDQVRRLNENRKRKARTAEIREMEALETCPNGHGKRWNTRRDGQCKVCVKAAARTTAAAEKLWTWAEWEILHDSEFATPIYDRLAPSVKEWLIRHKVKPE